MTKRKYVLAKRLEAKMIADTPVILYLFDDLDDGDLRQQFDHYLERDDFEYLEQIVGEAKLRGIKFSIRKD